MIYESSVRFEDAFADSFFMFNEEESAIEILEDGVRCMVITIKQ